MADSSGYSVSNQDSTTARRKDDLPLSEVLQVLSGLDKYREPALRSLAATQRPRKSPGA